MPIIIDLPPIQKQVTIHAIGIGADISTVILNRISSPGCSFLMKDFENAMKVFSDGGYPKEFIVQLQIQLEFSTNIPLKLGEVALLCVEV